MASQADNAPGEKMFALADMMGAYDAMFHEGLALAEVRLSDPVAIRLMGTAIKRGSRITREELYAAGGVTIPPPGAAI